MGLLSLHAFVERRSRFVMNTHTVLAYSRALQFTHSVRQQVKRQLPQFKGTIHVTVSILRIGSGLCNKVGKGLSPKNSPSDKCHIVYHS